MPGCLVDLVRLFMMGWRGSGWRESTTIWVRNGLHQGCTIAPTLFILYFEQVIQCWLHRCNAVGIEVLYKIGGKLVGECTRRPSLVQLNECLFADDTALICTSRSNMFIAAKAFEEVTKEFGLTLSILKTKLFVAGADLTIDDVSPLELGGGSVETVKEFKYLGSLIEARSGMTGEIVELHRLPKLLVSFAILCSWLVTLAWRLND